MHIADLHIDYSPGILLRFYISIITNCYYTNKSLKIYY